MHPLDYMLGLGAVSTPAQWFESGCSGPRARWTPEGLIEIENEGAKALKLPEEVKQWRAIVDAAAAKYKLWPQFVDGVMATESGGKQDAHSSCCYGLMGLLPATASDQAGRKVSVNELLSDPALNVDLGAKLLSELMTKYGGNPIKTVIAYNAGSVKCGTSSKCTAPNRWNVIADCSTGGVSADYPGRAFGYSNAAAAWLGANPLSSSASSGPGLGTLALGAFAVGGAAYLLGWI